MLTKNKNFLEQKNLSPIAPLKGENNYEKKILLASLVAQTTTIASGTTGSVEFFNQNEHEIYSTTDHQFKVKDSELSFGGTF